MKSALAVAMRLVRRESGQDLLEYALLAALIALVAVVAITTLGNTINSVFWQSIAANVAQAV